MANTEQEGSKSIATLWRLEQQARDEQRPALTLADIVAAAVEIADTSGLAELSMAKVARRLGFSTMALYRHVPNKGQMLTLMFDVGAGAPPASILQAAGWRAKMQAYARAFSEVFRRRPWLLDIPITGPPMGPNNIRWMDTGLTALAETGLDAGDRVEIFMVITSYLLGSQRLYVEITRAEEAAQRAGHPTPDAAAYGASLTRLMPPGRFPAVEEAIAAGAFDDEEEGDDLQREFDHILDGVEELMRRRGLRSGETLGEGGCG